MKALLTVWISVALIQEVVPIALIRLPQPASNKSSVVHTEYEAKYNQKGLHGNESLSTLSGKQQFVHENCSGNWNSFADKCANLIKELVASLANAVSSNPGDSTNLQLQIKNTFSHFDNTNCSCLNHLGEGLSNLDLSPFFNNITIKTVSPATSGVSGGQPNAGSSSSDVNLVTVVPTSVSGSQDNSELPGAENSGMHQLNSGILGDDSANNNRREVKYPQVVIQPGNRIGASSSFDPIDGGSSTVVYVNPISVLGNSNDVSDNSKRATVVQTLVPVVKSYLPSTEIPVINSNSNLPVPSEPKTGDGKIINTLPKPVIAISALNLSSPVVTSHDPTEVLVTPVSTTAAEVPTLSVVPLNNTAVVSLPQQSLTTPGPIIFVNSAPVTPGIEDQKIGGTPELVTPNVVVQVGDQPAHEIIASPKCQCKSENKINVPVAVPEKHAVVVPTSVTPIVVGQPKDSGLSGKGEPVVVEVKPVIVIESTDGHGADAKHGDHGGHTTCEKHGGHDGHEVHTGHAGHGGHEGHKCHDGDTGHEGHKPCAKHEGHEGHKCHDCHAGHDGHKHAGHAGHGHEGHKCHDCHAGHEGHKHTGHAGHGGHKHAGHGHEGHKCHDCHAGHEGHKHTGHAGHGGHKHAGHGHEGHKHTGHAGHGHEGHKHGGHAGHGAHEGHKCHDSDGGHEGHKECAKHGGHEGHKHGGHADHTGHEGHKHTGHAGHEGHKCHDGDGGHEGHKECAKHGGHEGHGGHTGHHGGHGGHTGHHGGHGGHTGHHGGHGGHTGHHGGHGGHTGHHGGHGGHTGHEGHGGHKGHAGHGGHGGHKGHAGHGGHSGHKGHAGHGGHGGHSGHTGHGGHGGHGGHSGHTGHGGHGGHSGHAGHEGHGECEKESEVVVPTDDCQSENATLPTVVVHPVVVVTSNDGHGGHTGLPATAVKPAVATPTCDCQSGKTDPPVAVVEPVVAVTSNDGHSGHSEHSSPAIVVKPVVAATSKDGHSGSVSPVVVVHPVVAATSNDGHSGNSSLVVVQPAVAATSNDGHLGNSSPAVVVQPAVVVTSNDGHGGHTDLPATVIHPVVEAPTCDCQSGKTDSPAAVVEPVLAVTDGHSGHSSPAVVVQPVVVKEQSDQPGHSSAIIINPTTFQTTSGSPTTQQPIVPTTGPITVPQDSGVTLLVSPVTSSKIPREHTEEDEEDDCCSCESCAEEEISNPKGFKDTACRNLEEARRELKKIFDKITKKLQCGKNCLPTRQPTSTIIATTSS